MKITLSADIKTALKTLETAAEDAKKGLAKSSMHFAAIVRKSMIESMPQGRAGQADEVAPGRFKRNQERSRPGQPPFKQSGKLARSIKFETAGTGARIFSEYQGTGKRRENDFLARIMETGTYKMKPRPFTKPAIDKNLSRLPLLMKTEIVKSTVVIQ